MHGAMLFSWYKGSSQNVALPILIALFAFPIWLDHMI
jgi:hypothetical protein